jgi:CBS domain-containing protein
MPSPRPAPCSTDINDLLSTETSCPHGCVDAIMRKNTDTETVLVATPGETLQAIIPRLSKVTGLPVVGATGKVVGVISRKDIIQVRGAVGLVGWGGGGAWVRWGWGWLRSGRVRLASGRRAAGGASGGRGGARRARQRTACSRGAGQLLTPGRQAAASGDGGWRPPTARALTLAPPLAPAPAPRAQVRSSGGSLQEKVKAHMTAPAITCPADMPVKEAGALMLKEKIRRLPVVDAEGKPLG